MSDVGTTISAGSDPFLMDEELRLLGAAVAYGALVETIAAGMHGALAVDADDPSLSSASTSGLQIGRLLKELRSSRDGEVAEWATAAEPAMQQRHKLVHTAWMIRASFGGGNVEAIFGSRTHRADPVTAVTTPGDLIACRDDLRQLWLRGRGINARLHGLEA